ncbi:MAG: 2-deoxy-D-gluconate 3-dehydrogenase [Planctomycetaceae bacterium]|nr:2-deoxy-D-gluconate 3-dehydrogenase [Planctomycetaceae bacterium]
MFDFNDHHVLISGGTSGIGRAIALAFQAAGAQVTITGLNSAEIDTFYADATSPTGPRINAVQLDVQDAPAIARLAIQLPQLDILVNCAGMILRGGAEFDPLKFQQVIDVNLHGTLRLCTAFRPHLATSHGSIINVASMLSFFGSGFAPAYSASKGAIAQLTKSLAIAWAPEGIRVNAIAPGWIVTPLTQPLVDSPERSQTIIDRTPLKRWGEPQDVTGAVQFLCSPAAAFITGVILPIDGGYSVA